MKIRALNSAPCAHFAGVRHDGEGAFRIVWDLRELGVFVAMLEEAAA